MRAPYAERIKEAEALAQRARDETELKAFREIAATWRRFAEAHERRPEEPPEPRR